MKIETYEWLDDRLVGGAKIVCDCGHVFELDTLDGEGGLDCESEIVECPKCKRKEKFHITIQMIFEKI